MVLSTSRLIPSSRLLPSARLGSSTWLLNLRSFAVIGQLVTIFFAWSLTRVPLPYGILLGLVGLTALTNGLYAVWLRKQSDGKPERKPGEIPLALNAQPPQERLASEITEQDLDRDQQATERIALPLMLLDLVTLTSMLFFSGGADNPFSFFYFVNLAVGGVIIRPRLAWWLTLTAIVGFGVLLTWAQPVEGLSMDGSADVVSFDTILLRSVGLMLAFVACASVVTYFVTQTADELKRRERQLLRSQAEQAASQRLEGLTTLAAGAAHELATPLSTIDVVARELQRHLEGVEKPDTVIADLHLIDGQLDMCRQILDRMRAAAGDSMAQRWDRTTVGELVDATLEGVRDPHRVDVVDASDAVENHPLWIPQEAVAQAVRNLIHNGLDASDGDGRVRLESRLNDQQLQLCVLDSGQGMTDEILDRAGDPFFTTKEPGRGIGMGLFLTRNVVSRLGGKVSFQSTQGKGTRATVTLPLKRQE